MTLEVAQASQAALDHVESVGGKIFKVYYTKLGTVGFHYCKTNTKNIQIFTNLLCMLLFGYRFASVVAAVQV